MFGRFSLARCRGRARQGLPLVHGSVQSAAVGLGKPFMFVSVFDVFKVGVGPSSSHTMGPMLAAGAFLEKLRDHAGLPSGSMELVCTLYGSLAFTGVGHGTHKAVLAGLMGFVPDHYDVEAFSRSLGALEADRAVRLGSRAVRLDPETAIRYDRRTRLDAHPNGMRLALLDDDGAEIVAETYYSVGGGFVMTEAEMASRDTALQPDDDVPYPFDNAAQMLEMGMRDGVSIAAMKRANELARGSETALSTGIARLWEVMNGCIERGLAGEGELPGGLHVLRRAKGVADKLRARLGANEVPLHTAVDWLSAYAMAVNEENAAGGQVVTAPTNGAAGVVPAVIRYYLDHVPGADPARLEDMFLTAAAVGGLIKYNASISGAEVGCQGEVGSASAMAAAGLCAALGGTNAQIENAAEIALEHHLGMTCDPVRGLVQVPCIERNGMGAVKAVAAASLSLAGDGRHLVPLDACIETMRQTGRDMDERYKETSQAGLSVSLPDC